ncbi:hypothetical protein APR12_005339 [Nocardia amikacinitolerans]|uniref:hypothetical protein n=1 Tax=Nocardia amikacinitolerans TaxID=756689 RepID=UPI0008342D8E|nr:hypothetical protein [Nocardia amikacinitolerans]MCP2319961.1 hypothetical protein [Nocardia amikacinitolerans]
MASNAFDLGSRTVARRGALRRGRGREAATTPLWPGMIPPQQVGQPLRRQQGKRSPRRGRPRNRRRPWLVGGATVGASLAAVAVVLVYAAEVTEPRQSATVADPVLGGGPGCEPTRSDQLVRGNGTGSLASGPDAILAFQHAYYVTKSGVAARAATTPDAAVSRIDVIDAGIASVPVGTSHCVLVLPLPDGRFDVVITETRPDAAVRTYRQFVTVTPRDGDVLISKIAPPDR